MSSPLKILQIIFLLRGCYEAGPFGYGLHRQLEALGIKNLVVCPRNWDEGATGVKTDKSDARALCVRLALYAAANRHIFSVVRVPTPAEEQARAQTRLRDQLRRTRQRSEAQGRSLLLAQGHRVTGRWWSPRAWPRLTRSLPPWLVALFQPAPDRQLHGLMSRRSGRKEWRASARAD